MSRVPQDLGKSLAVSGELAESARSATFKLPSSIYTYCVITHLHLCGDKNAEDKVHHTCAERRDVDERLTVLPGKKRVEKKEGNNARTYPSFKQQLNLCHLAGRSDGEKRKAVHYFARNLGSKLLLYKVVLKPIRTYGSSYGVIVLHSNIGILQRFRNFSRQTRDGLPQMRSCTVTLMLLRLRRRLLLR